MVLENSGDLEFIQDCQARGYPTFEIWEHWYMCKPWKLWAVRLCCKKTARQKSAVCLENKTAALKFNTDVILKLVPFVIVTFNKQMTTHWPLFCGGSVIQHHLLTSEHSGGQCLSSLKWGRWFGLCLAVSKRVFKTRFIVRLSFSGYSHH